MLVILNLVSSLHVPRGKYDTWNTPSEVYIDYRMLAVYPFATSSVKKLLVYLCLIRIFFLLKWIKPPYLITLLHRALSWIC
jgi:hypothetical protein